MRLRLAAALTGLLTSALALGQEFPELDYPREVTITEIPGVVAAGAEWEIAWWGLEDGDALIATPDGGFMFTQAAVSRIRKVNPDGTTEVVYENTNRGGTVAFDTKGRTIIATRPPHPTISVISPERRVLADNTDGEPFTGAGDIVVDSKGGFYFVESRRDPPRAHYFSADDELLTFGEGLRINGIMLSPDERTLYVTNRGTLAAFDIREDGMGTNQREFAELRGEDVSGDGMAIDSEGRLYVTSQYGVQVISPEGEFLGLIPTPRPCMSIAFSGPDKKTLFITSRGAVDDMGVEHHVNPSRTIYKLRMVSQGFMGRPK